MDYENNVINQANNYGNGDIPPEYKPLSPWAHIGYNILFSIPIVGLILLLIFSFNNNNIHRRNYARSFFCALIIVVPMIVLLAIFTFSASTATIDMASHAKFSSDMYEMEHEVFMQCEQMYGSHMAEGNNTTRAKVFYEIATGNVLTREEELPDGEDFSFDFLEDDEKCYEIRDFSRIESAYIPKDINLDGKENDKLYVTTRGKVFTLPGLEREEDGRTVYYLNSRDYIEENEI